MVTFTEEIPNGKLYFLRSEFNYYPTIWIFYSHSLSNKIRRLHKRCLRMIHNDKQSKFEELLVKYNSVSMHNRNTQHLEVQMYMVVMACLQM